MIKRSGSALGREKQELPPFAASLQNLGIDVEVEPEFLKNATHGVQEAMRKMAQAVAIDWKTHSTPLRRIRFESVPFAEEDEEERKLDVLHLFVQGSIRDAGALLARLSSAEAEIVGTLDIATRVEFNRRFRIRISRL